MALAGGCPATPWRCPPAAAAAPARPTARRAATRSRAATAPAPASTLPPPAPRWAGCRGARARFHRCAPSRGLRPGPPSVPARLTGPGARGAPPQVCALPPTINAESGTAAIGAEFPFDLAVSADVTANGAGAACACRLSLRQRGAEARRAGAARGVHVGAAGGPSAARRRPTRECQRPHPCPAVVPLQWTFTITSPNDGGLEPIPLTTTSTNPTLASAARQQPGPHAGLHGSSPAASVPAVPAPLPCCAAARLRARPRPRALHACAGSRHAACPRPLHPSTRAGRGQPERRVPDREHPPPGQRERRGSQRRGRRRGSGHRERLVPLPGAGQQVHGHRCGVHNRRQPVLVRGGAARRRREARPSRHVGAGSRARGSAAQGRTQSSVRQPTPCRRCPAPALAPAAATTPPRRPPTPLCTASASTLMPPPPSERTPSPPGEQLGARAARHA